MASVLAVAIGFALSLGAAWPIGKAVAVVRRWLGLPAREQGLFRLDVLLSVILVFPAIGIGQVLLGLADASTIADEARRAGRLLLITGALALVWGCVRAVRWYVRLHSGEETPDER